MNRPATALTHAWIWGAIDAVAAVRGLSPSGLARLAGLDPTSFNRSKRFTPEGRPRWPSTESLSKILDATGMSLDDFATLHVSPAALTAIATTATCETEPEKTVDADTEVRFRTL